MKFLALVLAVASLAMIGCSDMASPSSNVAESTSGKTDNDGSIQNTGIYIAAGDVNGITSAFGAIEDAMLDYSGPKPEPVALLLPAIQKVREAASRPKAKDYDGRSFVSADQLLNALEQAARKIKVATLTARKGGGENSAQESSRILLEFLAAFKTNLSDSGVDDRAILGALEEAHAPSESISLNYTKIKW